MKKFILLLLTLLLMEKNIAFNTKQFLCKYKKGFFYFTISILLLKLCKTYNDKKNTKQDQLIKKLYNLNNDVVQLNKKKKSLESDIKKITKKDNTTLEEIEKIKKSLEEEEQLISEQNILLSKKALPIKK